jgi:hypothetical protein
MKIKDIPEVLKNPNADGHLIAEAIGLATAEYSFIASLLQEILARKPAIWSELRQNVKSDTRADRTWDGTKDGIDETGYRMKLKVLEKSISSLKTILKIRENERFN